MLVTLGLNNKPLKYKPGHSQRAAAQRARAKRRSIDELGYNKVKIAGIRLRDKNAIVLELKFSEQQEIKLEDIAMSNYLKKKELMRDNAGVNFCCLCGKIPNYQIRFSNDGCVVIENYCKSCMNSVYFREDADKTNEELAAKYNCHKVYAIPHTPPEPYIPSRSRKS